MTLNLNQSKKKKNNENKYFVYLLFPKSKKKINFTGFQMLNKILINILMYFL